MTLPLPGQLGFGPTPGGSDAEELARRIKDLDQRLSALITAGAAAAGISAYPIGSIYLSVSNTNPATIFGGTWAAWGTGRVPVAVDTSQTEFQTVEQTGGEKTHVLTQAEMPSHTHGLTAGSLTALGGTQYYFNQGTSTANRAEDSAIANTGGGGAHNNLQPYITCYMWKRTA